MSTPAKLRYEVDLIGSNFDAYQGDRDRITPDDTGALARLMLEAYRGTIDFDDETLDDAVAEVASYFDGAPLLDHSFQIRSGEAPVSAILVSEYEDTAFVSYVMTDPAHKGRGLATEVTTRAFASLQSAGYERVVLYITYGNRPSERVFRGLGAVLTDAP